MKIEIGDNLRTAIITLTICLFVFGAIKGCLDTSKEKLRLATESGYEEVVLPGSSFQFWQKVK